MSSNYVDEEKRASGRSRSAMGETVGMKFGLSYNTGFVGTDPANLKTIARHADDLGFESFYVPEHVTLYPGARVGEVEFAPDLPIADPLECLAFVAASTSSILLGTGVLLLPFHHPVVLAKRLATIDVLSSGRMRLLTIGVSSLPGEAAAVGVDYATRGRRADEAIDVLRALWAGDATGTSFDGRVLLVRERDQLSKAAADAADSRRRLERGRRPPRGTAG
jgi:alkanesulfonate monooxygenase SsuD/methylene tetrahydromethanopterin reductase-like flavin-dependent oxidoreductase (luciferase family)